MTYHIRSSIRGLLEHQVLGSFVKLVSETLSCDAYLVFEGKVRGLQGEAFVGINTCNAVLTELQSGRFVKYKKIKDVNTTVKQWIVEYATKDWSFLVAVYNRQTWTETCIGIINNMIVES